jgi:hypothetical protein
MWRWSSWQSRKRGWNSRGRGAGGLTIRRG